MNAKMPELKRAFEAAGFTDVRTVLSSGNVVFSSPRKSTSALEAIAEAAMRKQLGREFLTIVRSIHELEKLLGTDPYRPFGSRTGAKRVVTFLRDAPRTKLTLPVEADGARILAVKERAVFVDYVPSPKGRGAVFMVVIERAFGKQVTTRTWETVKKVAR
jgi:uncharacterized protein (DUF1697 family)